MTDDARRIPHDSQPGAWRYGYVSADELRPRRPAARARGRVAQLDYDRAARRSSARAAASSRRGVALVVVITAIAILSVFVADLIESTTTDFHVAESERDRVKAEYLAKSGTNLLRLLIGLEPQIRQVVGTFYQMLLGRQPPQLNVWDFADTLFAPFADLKGATSEGLETTGIDFSLMKGVKDTGGTFKVITVPENSKINLSKPLFFKGDQARTSLAMQLFGLMDGLTLESPYDAMFSGRDPDGHFTTRLDIISAVIDWWDPDDQRTAYDPGSKTVAIGGSEDDIYRQFSDPYMIKNAPFDSLEELRLIRGIGDDFWASFIDAPSGDPRERKVTIYGSGAVNVNLAMPQVLLARLCSYMPEQPLCRDPAQIISFISLFTTAKSILPIALFSTPQDFFNFISGKSNAGFDMFQALSTMLKGSPLMAWTPFVIPPETQNALNGVFLTEASIFTLQSTGTVGRTQAKITMVINTDRLWTPPRGVAGTMPALGVVHYYRLE